MRKRIIAFTLSLLIALSGVSTAFGATLAVTKSSRVKHIERDIDFVKQILLEDLTTSVQSFGSSSYYFEDVWNEAQKLCKDESERIVEIEDEEELYTETIFGYVPNDKTVEVMNRIILLSDLNKSVVSKSSDLNRLKNELKNKLKKMVKVNYQRANYNDFYWDKLNFTLNNALSEIDKVTTYSDYCMAEENWEDFFDGSGEEINPLDGDTIDAGIHSKDQLEEYAEEYIDEFDENIEKLKNLGYKFSEDKAYELEEQLETALSKTIYLPSMYSVYLNYENQLKKLAGYKEELREKISLSDKKRAEKKVKEIFLTYKKENYSDINWEVLSFVLVNAYDEIDEAVYKDEVGDRFFKSFKEELKEVKTLSQELSEAKQMAVLTLKSYIGQKQYNQTKVKKLVNEGTKKINAATTSESVYSLLNNYTTAIEKTILTFKITVSKKGNGTVSKSANVKYGYNYSVVITPNAGYKISSITVDGKKKKLTNKYVFKNVTKAHKIAVTFSK